MPTLSVPVVAPSSLSARQRGPPGCAGVGKGLSLGPPRGGRASRPPLSVRECEEGLPNPHPPRAKYCLRVLEPGFQPHPLPHLGPISALKSQPGTGTLMGGEVAPRTSPSPCKLAQEESLRDQNAFFPTVLLKSLCLKKTNKQKSKHPPPNTPLAQTPSNLTIIL